MGTLRFQDPLSADWVALLFVLVLAQLAWTNVTSPKKWRLVMEGAFRTRISRRSMREEIDLQDRSLLGLWWAALVGGALFIYQVLVQSTLLPNGGLRYLEVFSLLALVAVAQVFLQRAVSFVFRGDGGLHEYTYSLVLSYLTMGLSLLPVSVLVTYRPDQRPWLCCSASRSSRWWWFCAGPGRSSSGDPPGCLSGIFSSTFAPPKSCLS
ncbi:MAG: DUF4271 domain-containing protein [Flavobacteriales bacterium]|nr:DUF4271 domain-containing protein [Flavobacteriales bacterium]